MARVTREEEILEAVNVPSHHRLLEDEAEIDRGVIRPRDSKRRKNSRRSWMNVDEPGDMPTSRGGIIR